MCAFTVKLFCRSKTQKKRNRPKTDSTSATEVKRQLSRQMSRQMSRQKSIEDEKAHVKETDTSKLIEEEKAESGNVHAL